MNQPTITSSADVYHQLYSDKTLLLKVSGQELLSEKLPKLIDDIRFLAHQGMRFLIVCGAGAQNTKHWKSFLERNGRPWSEPGRVDGRRVTDEEQLQNAVLPAHEELQKLMQQILPEGVMLAPEQIQCKRIPELGYVGEPVHIDGIEDRDIVIIPSVGFDGTHRVNVNADDITRVLLNQNKGSINEVLSITGTGGVLHKGKVVPLILERDISDDGSHPWIDITGGGGGMKKKLEDHKKMLQWIDKAVITGIENVREEIESIWGRGTMIISQNNVRCERLSGKDEEAIFNALYERHLHSGDFRSRAEEELHELRRHVHFLKVSNSILGAFALIPRSHWMELATLCSEYNGSGIGDLLINAAQKEAVQYGKDRIYAFASSIGISALFAHHYFENLGHVSQLKKENPRFYDCLPCIAQYDTTERDPYFCMWHRNA